MAYFAAPPGYFEGYDADGKRGAASLWRVRIDVGEDIVVLLKDGFFLEVVSLDDLIVPNDGFGETMSRADGQRRLVLQGRSIGTTQLEARGDGAVRCAIQVQVVAGVSRLAPDTQAEGFEVAVSAMQLAAILKDETIQEASTWTNRFWGGLTLVGGAIELVGAAALLVTPEPTLATKVAGGALGVHGADTASTGLRQIWSGKNESTLTSKATVAAALAIGMDPESAATAGMTVDIALPFLAGFVGAARVASVKSGRFFLLKEELQGGHTIRRHIWKSERRLRARLAREPRIKMASAFNSYGEAEKAISAALRHSAADVEKWARAAKVGDTRGFVHNTGGIIGRGVDRTSTTVHQLTRVRVVVRKVREEGKIFFLLTSYPVP